MNDLKFSDEVICSQLMGPKMCIKTLSFEDVVFFEFK